MHRITWLFSDGFLSSGIFWNGRIERVRIYYLYNNSYEMKLCCFQKSLLISWAFCPRSTSLPTLELIVSEERINQTGFRVLYA